MSLFNTPHMPFLLVHFYRQSYGDCGFKALPFAEKPDELDLQQALIERFRDPMRRMPKPLLADVVDEDGKVIMQARVRSRDDTEIVRLPNAQAMSPGRKL